MFVGGAVITFHYMLNLLIYVHIIKLCTKALLKILFENFVVRIPLILVPNLICVQS